MTETRPELTLFVSGASDLSARAIASATELCDIRLGGRYRLTVVDVHGDPATTQSSGVHATPTLVKEFPLPMRRLIGNLANTARLFVGLDLVTKGKTGR